MTNSSGKLLNKVYDQGQISRYHIDDDRLSGVVYTPDTVASEIVKTIEPYFLNRNISVLEPSVGDGAFIEALRKSEIGIASCKIIDIDRNAIRRNTTRIQKWLGGELTAHAVDFISHANKNSNNKFDLILGNPPFVKRQNFSAQFKSDLEKLAVRSEYDAKNLKNAWAAFTLASSKNLSSEGILAFVLPHELMTVNYSYALQEELRKTFERIDIFVPREKAFKDIDQDAVVMICKKKSNEQIGLFVNPVSSLSDLSIAQSMKIDVSENKNIGSDLASFLFDDQTNELIQKIRLNSKTVGNFCSSSPGIVTAANDFFILNKAKVEELKAWSFVRPVLQKAAFLKNKVIFNQEDFDEICNSEKPAFFLDLKDANEGLFSEELRQHIAIGEEKKLHERYKCRHRKPWFGVPSAWSAESYFFKRSHLLPRFCLNEADVLVTDTAYRIVTNENVSHIALGYSFYNPVTLLFAELDGRFYGGGVLELTPKEFKNLPISLVKTTKKMHSSLSEKYEKYVRDFSALTRDKEAISRKQFQLEPDEYIRICKAYQIAREHRLRH